MPRQYVTREQKLIHLTSRLKQAATRKHPKKIEITTSDLVELWDKQRSRCAITGLSLEVKTGGNWNGHQNPFVASIDRIDNTKGYVVGNVRLICWFWNHLKAKGTDQAVGRGLAEVICALAGNGMLGRLCDIK